MVWQQLGGLRELARAGVHEVLVGHGRDIVNHRKVQVALPVIGAPVVGKLPAHRADVVAEDGTVLVARLERGKLVLVELAE